MKPRDDIDVDKKFSFLTYEVNQLNNYYRHHKAGILTFFALYLIWFLTISCMVWIPILLIALPTVFLPTFYIFNYTTLMNPLIKFVWITIQEVMNKMHHKRVYDDKRHHLNCVNIGYADMFETMDGEVYVRRGHVPNVMDKFRLQMYWHAIAEVAEVKSLEDKNVLETGCGRGGGLKLIMDKFKPKHAVGIDLSTSNVTNKLLM